MRISRYLLIFLCFLPLLLFRDFTPNNELKYLSIADESIRNGHIFTFWNHGEIYADKPPFYFWLIMLGKVLLGNHYMLFLGLFSLLPALAITGIMDRWSKKEMPAEGRTSSCLALISSGLFTGAAIVLRMDMLMCLFIVLALYTFYKLYLGKGRKYDCYLLPVYIFLALFTKGPVGLLVPLLSITVFLFIQQKIKTFGRYLGWKQWIILSVACFCWFGAIYLEGGKTYLNNLLFHQTIDRAVNSFHHKAPFWYYFKTIWYSLAPWTLFYFVQIVRGIINHRIDSDLKKLFLTVILSTFIALSISSGKLDIYLLPIFPFIASLSFLLTGKTQQRPALIAIGVPATVLLFSFPVLVIADSYLTILSNSWIYIAALCLTLFAAACLYLLFRKQLYRATNTLAMGLLFTILIGGISISEFNAYIGFKEVSQKAQTIALKEGIENFYFYKLRSGKNIDVYLKQEIYELDRDAIVALSGKQNFMLFVKKNKLENDSCLQIISNNHKFYIIGDYAIIESNINE